MPKDTERMTPDQNEQKVSVTVSQAGTSEPVDTSVLFRPENIIGSVTEVSSAHVIVAITDSCASSDLSHRSHVGQYVVVDIGTSAAIGLVTNLKILPRTEQYSTYIEASIDLKASYDMATDSITPGVLQAPGIGNIAYPAPPSLIRRIMLLTVSNTEAYHAVKFAMAKLADDSGFTVELPPEQLVGRHCAIVGTSGGGKSWTVARLVEQCASVNSKVLLFDPSGEFHTMRGSVKHVHVGEDPSPPPGSVELSVPYYHLTEGDLFAIFKPSGPSQAPKLREAMKSLKISRLVPELALKGLILKADRSKVEFEKAYADNVEEIESSYADFDITKLPRQIENECVNYQRSPMEPLVWGAMNGNDLSYCVPLVNRIQDIINSPNLEPIFRPGSKLSLFREINLFLNDPKVNVMRVSLKYLSFDHNAREIVANAIGRHLLALARKQIFRKRPLLVVLDEAHQFLKASLGDLELNYPMDSFPLIAKEGRKYSITICMATQRPRDIPESVMSQMGTMIVHRLINHHDREVIERASVGLDERASGCLPTMAPGEAMVLGVDFPMPLFVQVEPPNAKPDSRGPNYQKYWKGSLA